MFYKKSNQILVPHLKNAFLNVWDFDTQLPADKISTQSIITSLFTL